MTIYNEIFLFRWCGRKPINLSSSGITAIKRHAESKMHTKVADNMQGRVQDQQRLDPTTTADNNNSAILIIMINLIEGSSAPELGVGAGLRQCLRHTRPRAQV